MDLELVGKVAIVTGGASGGLGENMAVRLLEEGCRVMVADRNAQRNAELVARLAPLGEVAGHVSDVSTEDFAEPLAAATVEAFGGIDVVVNNAANPLAQPLGQVSAEALTKSYDVNVRGPVFLVQEALPHLKASEHAAVLNMVSIGAFIFSPMLSIYSSAKAAMMSFTRSMAAEFVQFGIRVNALAPGPVDTYMMQQNPPEMIAGMVGGTLMKRLATPDEMVGAALLLTSDAGSYITGQVIIADGGATPR